MKFVFWWDSPCKGMIGVLREFCKLEPDTVVYTGETGKDRLKMGWCEQQSLFPQHVILKRWPHQQWCRELSSAFDRHLEDFHVVNGMVRPVFEMLLDKIIGCGAPYATMTEAPCNMYSGFRWLAKALFAPVIQPWRHRKFAATARAFISLSGEKEKDLRSIERLGFPRERIFPFGYYTDHDPSFAYAPAGDGKVHMLCPGLLEKYKGVDILIRALGDLRRVGVSGFFCHITGNGSQRGKLEALVDKFELRDSVILHGALDEKTYRELLTHIDILVAPGRREPWGIRINEAIQRGQAVVMSDGMGASTLIERAGGGSVFRSGSVEDLCCKLKPFLTDQDALAQAKKKNLVFAPQISCEAVAHQLHGILKSIL